MSRFDIRASADRGELWLYGDIGPSFEGGISADQVRQAVGGLEPKVKRLDCYVNSNGGDPFEGVAMHSILSRFGGEVRMHVDGVAASAASIALMAGSSIAVANGALIMVHEAWGRKSGNAAELRAYADTLSRVNAQMQGIYAKRTGLALEKVAALMAAETWMTGAEAVELGFADKIAPGRKVAALAGDLSCYGYRRPPRLTAGQPLRDRYAERIAALVRARQPTETVN